tara:strand:- start:240 stop:353 length:114 start_codon:yes stop_codon:yes gene_type:complete
VALVLVYQTLLVVTENQVADLEFTLVAVEEQVQVLQV